VRDSRCQGRATGSNQDSLNKHSHRLGSLDKLPNASARESSGANVDHFASGSGSRRRNEGGAGGQRRMRRHLARGRGRRGEVWDDMRLGHSLLRCAACLGSCPARHGA
jgi:hypothetical protein